jgi:hypothetical protein
MIKFHKYSKGGENMTKEDLNQIAIIVKTEVGGLRDEMNQRFKEQDEKIEQRFKEQDEKIEQRLQEQEERIDKRFKEQEEKFYRRIDQRISDQMTYFEEKYGRDFALAVECLNSKSETEDIQNQRLNVLEKSNNINSAAIFNHEDRINYLEKTLQIQTSK